jgi:hypothetical protein
LRCHAARPKYWDFVGPNGHRIAVVRLRDVADADLGGIAKVYRRAVRVGGAPLWQNTIEYKWLGRGEALDGRLVPGGGAIDRRPWPRRVRAPDDIKKWAL